MLFTCHQPHYSPFSLQNEGQTPSFSLIKMQPISLLSSLLSCISTPIYLSHTYAHFVLQPCRIFSLFLSIAAHFDVEPIHALLYFSQNVLHSLLLSLHLESSSRLSSNIIILVKLSPTSPNRIVRYIVCILKVLYVCFNIIVCLYLISRLEIL